MRHVSTVVAISGRDYRQCSANEKSMAQDAPAPSLKGKNTALRVTPVLFATGRIGANQAQLDVAHNGKRPDIKASRRPMPAAALSTAPIPMTLTKRHQIVRLA